jgi:putative membrane protein
MQKRQRFPILRSAVRILVILVLEVLALLLMAWLFPEGIVVTSWRNAFLFVFVVALLNAVLWPILTYITLPFITYTMGLFSLVLNGLILWLGSQLVEGIAFSSFWWAIGTAIGLTAITTVGSVLLTIDDDGPFYRNALKRQAKRARRDTAVKPYPGVIFLEIDGLSEQTFQQALQAGFMPNLKSWLDRGSHKAIRWEADTSCQTGGCQAGILLGNNQDMPAFRWVEKEKDNKIVTSNGPHDAPGLEEEHSNGNGLLSRNGRSRANLFTGDAEDSILTYSRVTSRNPSRYISFFFSSPYNFTRTLVLTISEAIHEIRNRREQVRNDVQPRLEERRKGYYPLARAMATVFLRDINTYTLLGDIFQGDADAIYVTYYAYDEVAHHSGVRDPDAMQTLKETDRCFGRLQQAASEAERKYEFVVLSDHGQVNGATFKQRYGMTLEGFIRSLLPQELRTYSALETNGDWDHVSSTMTDVANKDEKVTGAVVRTFTKSQTVDGVVLSGDDYRRYQDEKSGKATTPDQAQMIVLASGNLGLAYFTELKERMSYEQLEAAFPGLIGKLAQHEGIGFVMVRSEQQGAIVIGAKGTYFLQDDHVEGENPLAAFHPNAPAHLRRTDSFKHVPDLLVNSFYDPLKDEAAAFEELIGSHGGMGGAQSFPFILYPVEWELEKRSPIVGAESVYRVFKDRLEAIAQQTDQD